MTIDERIEALTQTVELIAAMQKANEERITQLLNHSERTEEFMQKFAHNSNVLIEIAQDHENRIGALEGN